MKAFKVIENLPNSKTTPTMYIISKYNSREQLELFDDIIKNPIKYQKRYEIFKKLSEYFNIINVGIVRGSFECYDTEVCNVNDTIIKIKNLITCTVNSDETYNIHAEINHNICKALEQYEDLELLNIKFKLHRHAKDYEPLEFDNSYQTEIKSIKENMLTSTIKNIKQETINHTIKNIKEFKM